MPESLQDLMRALVEEYHGKRRSTEQGHGGYKRRVKVALISE